MPKCRDCGTEKVGWDKTKAGHSYLRDFGQPHSNTCPAKEHPERPKQRVEPKLSPSRLAVLAGLTEIGYKKAEAYEIARDAEGDDFASQWKSATAKRAAEITS